MLRVTSKLSLILGFVFAVQSGVAGAAIIQGSTIINDWTRGANPYQDNVNVDNWSAVGNGVNYGTNSGGAIFSDFNVSGDFNFSSNVQALGDNDVWGLVFGYSDNNNGYNLYMSGGCCASPLIQLRRDVSGVETTLLSYSGYARGYSTDVFNLSVSRLGSMIGFEIFNVSTNSLITSQSVVDTTYMSGSVGLHTFSQATAFRDIDLSQGEVPVPAPIALLGIGLLGLRFVQRRR